MRTGSTLLPTKTETIDATESERVSPYCACFQPAVQPRLAHATAADCGKITVMVGGITKLIYLPARLTEQLGYFKDEGLDVELLSQPAGVDAENELLAGAVHGVVGFYDPTIDSQTKGKDLPTASPESAVFLLDAP